MGNPYYGRTLKFTNPPILPVKVKGAKHRIVIRTNTLIAGRPLPGSLGDFSQHYAFLHGNCWRELEIGLEFMNAEQVSAGLITLKLHVCPEHDRYLWPLVGESQAAVGTFEPTMLGGKPAAQWLRIDPHFVAAA